MLQKYFCFPGNYISIGSGKILFITRRLLVVGDQHVNKQSKNIRYNKKSSIGLRMMKK